MSHRMTRRAEVRRAAAKRGLTWVPSTDAARREIRRTRRQKYRVHRRKVLLFVIILALLLGGVVFYFGFDLVTMRGAGMSPTLMGGDMVLCVRQEILNLLRDIVPDEYRQIKRNDVVLIDYEIPTASENDDPQVLKLVRRVIALGGDELDAGGGELILNQFELVGETGNSDLVYPVRVPAGSMFLMGDQSDLSIDSRMRSFGMVQEASVRGRPIAVVWPLSAIKLVS